MARTQPAAFGNRAQLEPKPLRQRECGLSQDQQGDADKQQGRNNGLGKRAKKELRFYAKVSEEALEGFKYESDMV